MYELLTTEVPHQLVDVIVIVPQKSKLPIISNFILEESKCCVSAIINDFQKERETNVVPFTNDTIFFMLLNEKRRNKTPNSN